MLLENFPSGSVYNFGGQPFLGKLHVRLHERAPPTAYQHHGVEGNFETSVNNLRIDGRGFPPGLCVFC